MSLTSRLFRSKPKPRIAESPPIDILELKRKPYYIVASVEVGNSTTKSILTATNMDKGQTRIVNKTVKMTRDVRKPKPGEEVFAHTLCGTPLTREAVAELVRDTLLESHRKARLDLNEDLNFVILGDCHLDTVNGFLQARMNLYGNVLAIYDSSDEFAGSCRALFHFSKGRGLSSFDEIVLEIGTGHGILYQPLDDWIIPAVQWANNNPP